MLAQPRAADRLRSSPPAPPGPRPGPLLKGALPLVLFLATACGTHRDYAELQAGDRTFGAVWNAVDLVAQSDGFRPDAATSDRGLGVYQTRWDQRIMTMGRSGRRRLRAELGPDPDDENKILVRFYVETAEVKDLTLGTPEESDWDNSGQDHAYQELFARRLALNLGLIPDPTAEAPLRYRSDAN